MKWGPLQLHIPIIYQNKLYFCSFCSFVTSIPLYIYWYILIYTYIQTHTRSWLSSLFDQTPHTCSGCHWVWTRYDGRRWRHGGNRPNREATGEREKKKKKKRFHISRNGDALRRQGASWGSSSRSRSRRRGGRKTRSSCVRRWDDQQVSRCSDICWLGEAGWG